MIKVIPLTDKDEKSFRRLFTEYYTELGCDENITHLLDEYILPDLLAGLIRIELLHGGEDFIGFVIYQMTTSTTNGTSKKAGAIFAKSSYRPTRADRDTENFFYTRRR